jgi:hypothetical protein
MSFIYKNTFVFRYKMVMLLSILLINGYNKIYGQGGDNSVNASIPGNMITLPFTASNESTCNKKDDYNYNKFPKQECLNTLFTRGRDYVYAFKPTSNGIISVEIKSTLAEQSRFGVFLFRGNVEQGKCISTVTGLERNKHMEVQLDSTYMYFLLVDCYDTISCVNYSVKITAPASLPTSKDCSGAIKVCNNIMQQQFIKSGAGKKTGEIGANSCISHGELNSTWYTFTINKSGDLQFLITPYNKTDDFDFVLYNTTQEKCVDLSDSNAAVVACNGSKEQGITGMHFSALETFQDSTGSAFSRSINVKQGEQFILVITKGRNVIFAEDSITEGFRLDFSGSTAEVFNPFQPILSSAVFESDSSGVNSHINITFDQDILSNSLQPQDFLISGKVKKYTVTSVSSLDSQAVTKKILLKVEPALTAYERINLSFEGSAISDCGNSIRLSAVPVKFQEAQDLFIMSRLADSMQSSYILCPSVLSSDSTCRWSVDGKPIDNNLQGACITVKSAGEYVVTIKDEKNLLRISKPIRISF